MTNKLKLFSFKIINDGIKLELKEKESFPDGTSYIGFWNIEKDMKDGIGFQIWPDGSKF